MSPLVVVPGLPLGSPPSLRARGVGREGLRFLCGREGGRGTRCARVRFPAWAEGAQVVKRQRELVEDYGVPSQELVVSRASQHGAELNFELPSFVAVEVVPCSGLGEPSVIVSLVSAGAVELDLREA